jgi:hypothetical protein
VATCEDEIVGAPIQGREGFGGKRRDERKEGKPIFSIHRWKKALKGEAQERWELKEAS